MTYVVNIYYVTTKVAFYQFTPQCLLEWFKAKKGVYYNEYKYKNVTKKKQKDTSVMFEMERYSLQVTDMTTKVVTY